MRAATNLDPGIANHARSFPYWWLQMQFFWQQGVGWWAPERQDSCQALLSPKARLQKEPPGDVISNPTRSVRGVAVARSTTLSRKGWPEPGSWQWGIKATTDLDVIQSKPPSSWTNLQLGGSHFKVPLGDTALPFSGFTPAAKPGCAVPCGPVRTSGMQSYAFPNELPSHVTAVNFFYCF